MRTSQNFFSAMYFSILIFSDSTSLNVGFPYQDTFPLVSRLSSELDLQSSGLTCVVEPLSTPCTAEILLD